MALLALDTPLPILANQNGLELICKRYAHKGPQYPLCTRIRTGIGEMYGKPCDTHHETPEMVFQRISMGRSDYFEMLARLLFLPNSPTIFNYGTGAGSFSACFVFHVEDSMAGIMDVARKAAMVQKFGGGVGYYLGNLRAKNSPIASTHGYACGPVAVFEVYNEVAKMVTQGGKRDGAQMAILPWDHPDIREFIHVKDKDPQNYYTFNISVSATDAFMSQAIEEPHSEEGKLFWQICESAWKTGDPGVYFFDAAERGNPTPWIHRLLGTNPCGEVPLGSDEACNLASIDVSKFVSGSDFDWLELRRVASLATEYLDDILEANVFPDPAITEATRETRKLGLGVMGWADALALLHIPYDSDEAVKLGGEVMGVINTAAHVKSKELGKEKGAYPGWAKGESWRKAYQADQIGHELDPVPDLYQSRRNATLTCIAPTGSISILAGCSSGIEPHFAVEWDRRMGDGTVLKERIPVMDRLNGFRPKGAMEITEDWHVKHQAEFQKHVDLAASKTINLPEDATVNDIHQAYSRAWKMGSKGITIYRDRSRGREAEDQVLTPKVAVQVPELHLNGNGAQPAINGRTRLPDERNSITHHFQIGEHDGYVTVGLFDDGRPGEIFMVMSKEGSTLRGLMDAFATAISIGLQYGVPLETFIKKFRQTSFEPYGLTTNPEIRMASSVIDYVFSWLALRFGTEKATTSPSGSFCPECGGPLAHEESCVKCVAECGYSRC